MSGLSDLLAEVERLSRDAYALARSKADGETGDIAERAAAIDHRLDDLIPVIQSAQGDAVTAIQSAWTDARADALWAMSDGTMPTSLRLGAYIRDRAGS